MLFLLLCLAFLFWGRHSQSVFTIEPRFYILFSHTNYLHVLVHYIHKPLLWSSSWPPAWQFKTRHPPTNVFTMSLLDVSKPSQSGISDLISWTSNMCCLLMINFWCYPSWSLPKITSASSSLLPPTLPPVFCSMAQSLDPIISAISLWSGLLTLGT